MGRRRIAPAALRWCGDRVEVAQQNSDISEPVGQQQNVRHIEAIHYVNGLISEQ